ncbi:Membrane protein insertase YidC [Candidatus Sulfotelmatobacter kueseliae]|uniref:Membrane protein insertase YidC n=1 Tax=Candidatus Sulfotelmatobacter kueseliae TaxID=2042962 RepID=A0A2U3LC45_9BACT|nr:Membrane protein insertase YidC [Candidatus Sulfotelmatobacter kueseliae]
MAEYRNPQLEPGNERRFLLIFLVMFVIMLAFQPLLKKFMPQPPAQPQQAQSTPQQPAPTAAAAPAAVAPTRAPAPTVTKQAASEAETVIENDLYRITFTNRGAQVKSWLLKKWDNETGQPQDLVNAKAAAQYGYPLSLWTYDESLRSRLSSALYVTVQEGKLTAPATITFEYADQDLVVRKTFGFDHSYVVNVETAVTYKGSSVAAFPAWPSGFGDQTTPAFYAAGLVDYQYNKNIQRVPARCGFSLFSKCAQVVGGATVPGPFHWAGPTDQYFAAVFIPDDPAAATMVTLHSLMPVPRDPEKADSKETINVNVLGAAVGNLHGPTSERVFVGPKELEVLEKISVPGVSGADNDLNGLIDFGWWGIIAKPLFLWLKWTYRHVVANWGWAIVFQTFVITIALLPLRITQMKSMLKMQRVAPQIKAIQEKYKKYSLRDPRKAAMNEEIGALYKKEGVNPAGGCLPMLIQLPFLIAYYRMLGAALDLRHAHWLWIHDLSAAEPFPFVLPVLMVVSMLLVQKMTPQAGMDPAQQRMMTVMMPLFMGFIFFRLPAGLNLYYAESNLISIAQQSVMNRTKLGREMRELMEKRARKKEK